MGFACVSLSWAQTLPQGGRVAQGEVAISQSATQMAITQSTAKAVVNWDSFDIGANAKVNIHQPNSQSVLLNRVMSDNPSQIMGQLQANGQVVLVNPKGIVVGSDGSVSASAFTASTLSISDTDFMAGNHRFTRECSTGEVINKGRISTAPGGYVALLGAQVSNEGQIIAPQGSVAMGAAETVSVPIGRTGRIKLELSPASINASVANQKGGLIVAEGGQVYMQAAALSQAVASVLHSGHIDTSGVQAGAVHVLADSGQVRVDGSITANSSGLDAQGQNLAGGDIYIGRDKDTNVLAAVGDASGAQLESQGGFVETSGQFLKVDGARVIAKDWLLDPFNITIVSASTTTPGATGLPDYTPNASSTILASDITTHLNVGTNVTISTAGAGNDEGNITVNADIVKTSTGAASLTLIADNNITVNNKIAAEGGATGLNVTLRAGQTTNAGRIHLTNTSLISAEAGDVILQTQGGAIFNALNATISGKNVTIDNTGGAIAADGSVTAGSGTNAANESAITIIANITATDNLNLQGRSVSHNGIVLGGNRTLSGGRIQAVGQTGAGGHVFNSYGVLIQSGARVVTTGSSGDSVIKGIRQSQSNIVGQGALQTQAASVEAALGTTLTLEGHAIGSGMASHPTNSRGIRIEGLLRTQGDIRLLGTSVANDGVLIIAPLAVETGSLNINGTMTALGGGGRSGVGLEAAHNITLSHGTSLTIVGHAANTGTATSAELGVSLSGSILQAAGATAGDISITGSAASGPGSEGVLLNGAVTTSGNIHVVGQVLGNSRAFAARVNANLTSVSGDIAIQSIGGRIMHQANTRILKGRNITIDNTGAGLSSLMVDTTAGLNLNVGTAMGGSIDAATGAITAGSGTQTLATVTTGDLQNNIALILAGTVDASGNVNVRGNKKEPGLAISVTSGAVLKSSSASAQININSDKDISSAGSISAGATGAVVTLNAGSISSTSADGIDLVDKGTLLATATAGELRIDNAKIVGDIFARAVGNIGITNVGAVTLSASTTNNGNISVSNSGGTLSLGTVNAQSGIAAHGTGDVTLTGTSSIGGGVVLRSGVDVTGRNITLSGTSTDATGLGFQGEGGAFNATGSLSLTGTATGSGDGFYNFRGPMTATNGISITGTSGSGKGVGLDATAQVTNGSSGDIVITGSSSTDAISLRGMSISNGGGDITLMANQGRIFSDTGNPAWGLGASLPNTITQDGTGIVSLVAGALAADSGAIDGTALTIAQNNNAGVWVRTAGTGNITTPKIINVGTGDVVVAAGSSILAGTGAGGQVLTVAGNTITQDSTGKTYIYSGQASTTGKLSRLSADDFSVLYYQGVANPLNAQFNTAFDGTPTNDFTAPAGTSVTTGAQVFFREASAPTFSLALSNLSKVYGNADPVAAGDQVALNAALQTAYNNASGPATLSTTTGVDGGNLFEVQAAEVISALVGTSRAAGENVGVYDYGISASAFNTTLTASPQLVISKRDVELTGITADDKTYDGNNTASINSGAINTGVGSETLGVTGSGTFSDANAADGKTVSVTDVTALTKTNGTGDWNNYNLSTIGALTTTANITRKDVTLDSITANNKVYDGNDTATITSGAISTGVGTETLAVSGSGVFSDADAANNKVVTVAQTSTLTQTDGSGSWSNYRLTTTGPITTTANIVQRAITVALQGSVEKTYDGLDSATLNSANFASSGWISGEGASITQTAAVYANHNVSANPGNGTVSANLQLSDYAAQANTDLNNYSLATSVSGAVGKINPAALNIKVNDTKMFVTQDANLAFDQGFSYTGLVNGEIAANALTGGALGAGDRSYTGAQFPGMGSLSGVYGLSTTPTALNGNYSVSVTPGNLQVIPADQLLVTVSSQSDAYGQRKAPQAGVAASGTVTAQYCFVMTDCNGSNQYTLDLNTSNGTTWQGTDNTGNTITLGTGLAGTPTYSSGGFLNAGNHNYALASLSSSVSNQFNGHEVNGGVLTITPLQVSLNASDVTKVYDGNESLLSATLSPSGTLPGDALQAAFTSGSFDGKNAGPQGFTLSGLSLQGTDQANYVLGNAQLSGTSSITPKAITLSGLQASNKVYDGTTQASVQTSGAVFNGIVAGDQLSVTATGLFDTRHVGTHKTVSLSSSFGGTDLGNYTVTTQASSTANITPAPLLVTAADARKTYDGNTSASGVGTVGTLVGAAAGDTVAFAGSLAFTDKNAGTDKTVTVTSVRLVDASNTDVSGNYAITYVDNQNGTIDRANASITAQDSSTVYNGAVQSQTGLVLSGFVAGDDVQATGLASGRNAGSYLSSLSASGADAGNYNITFSNAALSITKRPAILSALGQSVVYNGLFQNLNGTQGTGFVAGDALSFGGLPSGRNVGQYTSAMTVSGADAANYDITLGSATLTITLKSASVTARPERATYNGQTQQQSAALVEGFVAGDDIQVSGLATGRHAGVYGSNVLVTGLDASNYNITYQQSELTIDKAPLKFVGTLAADKMFDGNTAAQVSAGRITGLMGLESLQILSLSGQFESAESGTDKPVSVVYGLGNGLNGGLVANYDWAPVTVLANIDPPSNVIQPAPEARRPVSYFSRLSYMGFGGLVGVGATTGQLHYPIRPQNSQQCSAQNLEACICEHDLDVDMLMCKPEPQKGPQTPLLGKQAMVN